MSDRPWYQSRLDSVMFIGFLGFLIFLAVDQWRWYSKQQQPEAITLLSGKLEQPLYGTPVLHLYARNQFPGNLHNGMVLLTLDSSQIETSEQVQVHSFEVWEPNREHQVTFEIPVENFNPDQPIPIKLEVAARNARPYEDLKFWKGFGWHNADSETP